MAIIFSACAQLWDHPWNIGNLSMPIPSKNDNHSSPASISFQCLLRKGEAWRAPGILIGFILSRVCVG